MTEFTKEAADLLREKFIQKWAEWFVLPGVCAMNKDSEREFREMADAARAYLESLKRGEDGDHGGPHPHLILREILGMVSRAQSLCYGRHPASEIAAIGSAINSILEPREPSPEPKPDAPKERTCEEALEVGHYHEALRLHRSEVKALKAECYRLKEKLHAETACLGMNRSNFNEAIRQRDELARRIEKAKHELGDRYGWIHAILEGRNK